LHSGLLNLIVKEAKDLLRDPKVLVGMVLMPLLLFPIMGSAISISMQSAQEQARYVKICIMDLDERTLSQTLVEVLANNRNITVIPIEKRPLDEAVAETERLNGTALIILEQGFSQNLTAMNRGGVTAYALIKRLDVSESNKMSVLNSILRIASTAATALILEQAAPTADPSVVTNPISISYQTIYREKLVSMNPSAIIGIVISQGTTLPVIVMVIFIFAMQIAATSIAVEKEQRALETLLTLPVNRVSILGSKLIASAVIAGAGSVAYIIGFRYYMESFMTQLPPTVDLASLGLIPPPTYYVLLGLVIFIALTSALSIAILLAVFAEDVRGAQSLVGYLTIPILVPGLFLMFTDIATLPMAVQVVLYAIPFTYPVLSAQAGLSGDFNIMLISIAYLTIFTVVVLYFAGRVFATEKILTARFSLRRRR